MTPMEFHCGMISGESTWRALVRVLELFAEDDCAVIRSIDSSRSMVGVARIMEHHGVRHRVVHANVCVEVSELRQHLEKLFYGFDEVWLFRGGPPHRDIAEVAPATSDRTELSEHMPTEILSAMEATGCALVLGDGCGLNYATTDTAIEKILTGFDS